METPQAMPQPAAAPKALAPALAPGAAGLPPWFLGEPHRRRARTASPGRGEKVHWSVVALTLFTALSLVSGWHGAASSPRELLPIMVLAPSGR
jgi:hypothetical protein